MSAAPPASGEPAGFGKVAKRLSGWAANLFATALILVAGLALGRQVLEWWQADSPHVDKNRLDLSSNQGELGNPNRSHLVEVGDVPIAMRREKLTGNKAAAFATLRARGKRAVSEPIEPRGKAGPAEQRMLSQIGEQKPTAQVPGRWELYELDGPLLLVAGIQFFAAEDGDSTPRRVVFWGLAVPHGAGYSEKETPWTLFSYQPAMGASATSSAPARISLPKTARVTLSLTAEDGASVVGFRASGDSPTLSRQIESAFTNDGWKPGIPWRQVGKAWQGRFEKSGQAAEVQWSSEVDGALIGVVTITPQ